MIGGTVGFGAREISGKIVPVIEVMDRIGNQIIEFVCVTHSMETWEEAKQFSLAVSEVMTDSGRTHLTDRIGGL